LPRNGSDEVVGGVMKKNRKRTRRKKGFMVGDWHEQAGGNATAVVTSDEVRGRSRHVKLQVEVTMHR
jgi:hypothetical protein